MPRVTIVVPAYNAERYLKSTLESAITQTFRDIDIVVIDDGSGDATGASPSLLVTRCGW